MTNVVEIVEKLKHLGYEVYVNDGKIKCVHVGKSKPRDDEVLPLVDMLKTCKGEAMRYLQLLKAGLSPRDYTLEQYIGKPSENPQGNRCTGCGKLGQRYCLSLGNDSRWWWGWRCLGCSPERN